AHHQLNDANLRDADLRRRWRRHGHELGLAGAPEGLDADARPAVRATGWPHGTQNLDHVEAPARNNLAARYTQPRHVATRPASTVADAFTFSGGLAARMQADTSPAQAFAAHSEIFTGRRAAGLPIVHVVLDTAEELLRARIEASDEARHDQGPQIVAEAEANPGRRRPCLWRVLRRDTAARFWHLTQRIATVDDRGDL